MPALKNILKPLATVPVEFSDGTTVEIVKVTYRPQYMTPKFEAQMKALREEDQATDAFLEMFLTVIAGWDLKVEDTDPEPIPLTKEGVQEVPYEILGDIIAKVQEEVAPKPKTETDSDSTLQPADS